MTPLCRSCVCRQFLTLLCRGWECPILEGNGMSPLLPQKCMLGLCHLWWWRVVNLIMLSHVGHRKAICSIQKLGMKFLFDYLLWWTVVKLIMVSHVDDSKAIWSIQELGMKFLFDWSFPKPEIEPLVIKSTADLGEVWPMSCYCLVSPRKMPYLAMLMQ